MKTNEFDNLKVFSALKDEFNLDINMMRKLRAEFVEELKCGLTGEPSSFAMLPSYVHTLPSCQEKGEYLGLDFGGTNFRATKFKFDGRGGSITVDEHKLRIPDDIRKAANQQALFDFFVKVMSHLEFNDTFYNIGFTFSFPIKQKSVNAGELVVWTKGFDIDGVVGEDVVALFEQAIKRQSKACNCSVKVLINDTVGTLASGKFRRQNCVIGLILGTGTNAAYVEKTKNITKLSKFEQDASENMAVNVEWGAFGDLNHNLPRTLIDQQLDEASVNKGQQSFEKMISGYYLGEIVRRIILHLEAKGEIFQNGAQYGSKMQKKYGLGSIFVSILDSNLQQSLLEQNFERFERQFEMTDLCSNDKRLISQICTMVVARAAKLTAIGISALLSQVHGDQHGEFLPGVGIDGSLFEHTPSFQKVLRRTIKELDTECEIFLAKDGSGKGAALLAAALARNT